ncbi:uncharacterized protein LOC134815307 isoform X2 [Bolinopsis microptera]|uniref:uncharacterized protein LOC134815307 isoform X2 n=1 Tax=Bolinopsis microptera TaxID=2820187 RepID=UPI003079EBA9
MPVISANVSPMPENNHVAVRPGRVDCIYNRTRGRNIKDYSRPVVSLNFTRPDQGQISSPLRAVPAFVPVIRTQTTITNTLTLSSTPLIDSKKANFEAYLRSGSGSSRFRTSPPTVVLQQASSIRPGLQYQLTDPGSPPPKPLSTSSSSGRIHPTSPQYQRSSSVPAAGPENHLSPPDPHKHIRGALNYLDKKGPKVSVLLANPSSKSPGIRLTTASPPPARHRANSTDNLARSGDIRKMDSHDSGYGNSPGKLSIDKSDSVDISEIEAEYYKTIPPNREMSPANVPLYVNKLSELFTTKRHFEAFLKSEFKYVAVASVIEAARGFVITASKEDVQFLKVKLPMIIPGGCSVHEMSSDEEINTFYLILKPVPEDIVISTVMRSLIEKKFPVKKIKRISNKVTREKTKVVVVTLESTHKKLLAILETGTIQIGEHTVRAFLLYPNSGTGQSAHFMTSGETSTNNSPMTSMDYTLGTLSPLGGSQWSSGAFDSIEHTGEVSSRPAGRGGGSRRESADSESSVDRVPSNSRNGQQVQQRSEEKPPRQEVEVRSLPPTGSNKKQSQTRNQMHYQPKSGGGVVLAPPQDTSVYSAIERMLISSKTGIHPVQQNGGVKRPYDQNAASNQSSLQSTQSNSSYQQYSSTPKNSFGESERSKSHTVLMSGSTISVDGSEPSDRTIIASSQQVTSPQRPPTPSRRQVNSSTQRESSSIIQTNNQTQFDVNSLQTQSIRGRASTNQSYKSTERPKGSRRRAASSEREQQPGIPLTPLREDSTKSRGYPSNPQIPPPKPKRTHRPVKNKQVNGGTKGLMLTESLQRGSKPTYDSSRKVSFKDKPHPTQNCIPKTNCKVVRNVSVQYEEMPPDFSDFMLDQEDSYFCKLDGLVKLMKERPTSQETQDLLMKVREANLARSRYGVTYVEPGRNEDEEMATAGLIGEMLRQVEEAKQRMVTGDVDPPDLFCFQDILKPKEEPEKVDAADNIMKHALVGMIKKQSVKSNQKVSPSPPNSTSPPSSSNCVFVTDKKTRRKTNHENFAVANAKDKKDLAGALISRIVKNDISKSDDVSRDSYNVTKNTDSRTRRASCSQIIVTSSRKPHRPSVLQCSPSGSHCSTSSEQSLISDLSKTLAVSNERVGRKRNGSSDQNHVSDILSSMFGKARLTSEDSSSGGRSARDKFMSSSSPSFNHDHSIDEDGDTDMEIFVNRAREMDEEKPVEKTQPVSHSGRSSYSKSNNTIQSVMNSFLEETMLQKMGSTMGDLEESNFY